MSSGKREAGSELNQDNWNDEETVEVARDFRKAPEDVLSKREMMKAKQSLPVDLSCSAPQTSNEQSSGSSSPSSADKRDLDTTEFSQQNYSCYTTPINSMNSYMTARDPKVAHSVTTQSTNYSVMQESPSDLTIPASMHINSDSPQYQPQSIPTYSAAVNARSMMNNSTTQSTNSQHQISSIVENHANASKSSLDDSDSNSWSGMDLTKRAEEPAAKSESKENTDEGVSSSNSPSKENEELK